jgi:hypothetical protein
LLLLRGFRTEVAKVAFSRGTDDDAEHDAGGDVRAARRRPRVPLLSGGKDPTLGERFEEELYRS